MSKASEWLKMRDEVNSGYAWTPTAKGQSYQRAEVLGTPKAPFLRFHGGDCDGQIDYAVDDALALARWILDTFSDDPRASATRAAGAP